MHWNGVDLDFIADVVAAEALVRCGSFGLIPLIFGGKLASYVFETFLR